MLNNMCFARAENAAAVVVTYAGFGGGSIVLLVIVFFVETRLGLFTGSFFRASAKA